MALVVGVAIEQTAYHFDKLYSYTADATRVKRGCRVLVPFGKGNRYRQGVVMTVNETDDAARLKPIAEVLDEQPLLSDELLDLALWMKERTFCTVFDAVRAMLPTGLYWNVKPVFLPVRPLCEDVKMSDEETAVYKLACAMSEKLPDGVPGDKLLKCAGLGGDSTILTRMLKRGWLTRSDDAFRRSGDATRRMVRLTVSPEELSDAMTAAKCSPKQKAVLQLLCEAGVASVKELCYLAGVTEAVITAVVKKQLAEIYDQEWLRSALASYGMPTPQSTVLNEKQQTAFDGLLAQYHNENAACALLYGVTGSGKTQVYMNLIDRVIADGKSVLVLVPEISLTPQVMEHFLHRYGARVAVLHSGLSVGERMDEWKRIRRGEASIVVGTRSAVFAPIDDLGLIVMDEEQEHTYKSESTPRYHTREVAKFRCARHKALLLLASATPSVESYHAATNGRYTLHTLDTRYGDAVLPQVEVVDMREQTVADGVFSEPLIRALRECFDNGEQAILLLNRRGYQTFVSCRSCGQVVTCPSCSISMTYHRANGKLMCHYCGHMQSPTVRCAACGSEHVRYSGIGTQRVEEELERLFPDIRVLRMDTDTTMSRLAYEEKFKAFAEGQYQVMIGTQMVAKGLDFPDVSLVGVLSADQSLYAGDYRAYETTFSLLTQVIGRAGRREKRGKAVIQTTTPEHYIIGLSAEQNYPAFYNVEITMRRQMKYPPFAELCVFGLAGLNEAAVREASVRLLTVLRQTVQQPRYEGVPLIVLDPTPAAVSRVAGKYRYKLLVKIGGSAVCRRLIGEVLTRFAEDAANRDVSVFADRNPATIL